MSVLAFALTELSSRGAVVRAVRGLARALRRRREVAELRSWDDHALADIGLSRDAVDAALMGSISRDPSAVLCEWAGREPRAAAARRAARPASPRASRPAGREARCAA